jgi:hypothetical protein
LHGNQQWLGQKPAAQGDVDKVRPAVVAEFGVELLLVQLAQALGVFADHAGSAHPVWWCDAVAPVPAGRVVFQRLHQGGQFVLETVLRLPAQQVTGAARVECVVVVGHFGHERPHKRGLALVNHIGNDRLQLGLDPQPGSGDGFGHLQRRPVLHAVHERPQPVLQRVIPHSVLFTDEDVQVSLGSSRRRSMVRLKASSMSSRCSMA